MIRLVIFYLAIFGALYSCTSASDKSTKSSKSLDTLNGKTDDLDYDDSLPNKRFGKSEIINSKFDKNLIFGVWTFSYDDPACEFDLNEERYRICDYDGDGDRLYRINGDSIFLDNPYLIFKGKIIKATSDTLIIHWQKNNKPETLLRWKN